MDSSTLLIIIVIVVVTIAIVIAINIFTSVNAKKARRGFENFFGKVSENKNIPLESVSYYWYEKVVQNDVSNYIDDTTWWDLDMDEIYARIDSC